MRLQRDQALACLLLALCAALAVFLSVFGKGERLAVKDARRAVALHEGLQRQAAAALRQNQGALEAARAALLGVEGAHRQ